MKRLTIEEKFGAIMQISGITATQAHIAMAFVLGKSREEMTEMYGQGTLSTSLNKLKKMSVVKNIGHGEWELTSPDSWGKENVSPPTVKNEEREATLELMADLEKQIKELKKRVG